MTRRGGEQEEGMKSMKDDWIEENTEWKLNQTELETRKTCLGIPQYVKTLNHFYFIVWFSLWCSKDLKVVRKEHSYA